MGGVVEQKEKELRNISNRFGFFCCTIGAAATFIFDTWKAPTPIDWAWIVGVAIFYSVSQYAQTISAQKIPANLVTGLRSTEMVWAFICKE